MRSVLALILVGATTLPAAADGIYITEGAGGTDIKDELGATMGSAVRLRIALGLRRGSWAVEGWFAAHFGVAASGYAGGDGSVDEAQGSSVADFGALTTYGLDLKYLQPMAEHVDVYLRGSMSGGFMEGGGLDGYAGRGLGVGAGVQLKGKVRALGFLAWPLFFLQVGPKITAALWLDTGYELYRLHPGGRFGAGRTVDAQLTSVTGGFALGSDF
ncbi:MAG: hypothetical protein M3680_33735 [Myxococcota bacterium]|nr:hypothetical protein [Myxococcota bacterium]